MFKTIKKASITRIYREHIRKCDKNIVHTRLTGSAIHDEIDRAHIAGNVNILFSDIYVVACNQYLIFWNTKQASMKNMQWRH